MSAIKKIKAQIEELANDIDDQLGRMERNNKDDTEEYEELFEISSALHELID